MNPQDEAVAETGRQLTKYSEAHAHEVGLPSPQAVNFMFSVANMLYSSALVTKDMGLSKDQVARLREFGVNGADLEERDKKAVVSNAMGKMLVGRELGIEPMAALQDIDIVKSKIFVRYPQLHRLIEQKGWDLEELQRDHERAAIKLTHATKKARTFEFTLDDAKRAGLTKRGGYNGDSPSQYELRPRVMLWSRVISEAYRATGGKGSIYALEEKSEILADEPAEPESQAAAAPEKGSQLKIGRRSTKQTPAVSSDAAGGEGIASTERAEAQVEPSSHSSESEAAKIVATEAAPQPKADPESVHYADEPAAKTVATAEVVQNPDNPAVVGEGIAEKLNAGPQLVRPNGAVEGYMKQLKAKLPEAKLQDYLRGFLDITRIPANHQDLEPALAFLTSMDPVIVLRDPHRAGADAGIGYRSLVKFTKNWGEDCKQLAFAIALERHATSGGGDLYEYLQGDPIFAEHMRQDDLLAFLRVLRLVPMAIKLATMLREATGNAPGNLDKVVSQWEEAGMDLNAACTPEDIESAVLLLAPPPQTSPEEALASAHDPEDLFAMMRGDKK